MAEDLSYLRTKVDAACDGIARLEEQNKNLFHRYEEDRARAGEAAKEQATLRVDVTTQGNRISALEAAKEKGGNRLWEVLIMVGTAVASALAAVKMGGG